MRTAFDRASFGITAFSNRYDDFIEMTDIGFNPRTRLLEFHSQNLEEAEITGVELRGEAYLTDSVMIRGSYAHIDGVEISKAAAVPALAEETPLRVPLRRMKECWASATSVPRAAGAASCPSAWSSPTGTATGSSSRRTPTRSSILWALSRSPRTSPFALAYST